MGMGLNRGVGVFNYRYLMNICWVDVIWICGFYYCKYLIFCEDCVDCV